MTRYRYIRPLGQGSAGQSYLAEDSITQTKVVIKRFFHESSASSVREVSFLQQLSHPAIPTYIDSFVEEVDMVPRFHLVTEYVDANTISSQIVDPWSLATQVLTILQYLHSQQPPVIHRDIKPNNLLWTTSGDVLLIDFGSAILSEHKSYGHTMLAGTLGYQAPEQIHGEPVPVSDLYSLGAVLVEIISRKSAFSMLVGQTLAWEDHIDIPPIAILWLRKLLHSNPNERFENAQEALHALGPVLKECKAEPITASHHPRKWIQLFSQSAPQETKEKWKGWVLLQEKGASGEDWGLIAECWRLLGEQQSYLRTKDKERAWLHSLLSAQERIVKHYGFTLSIDELLKTNSFQELRIALEEDTASIEAILAKPTEKELRLLLQRLLSRYPAEDLNVLLQQYEEKISKDFLNTLEDIYRALGLQQRANQVQYQRNQNIMADAAAIQDALKRFDIDVEFGIPIRSSVLNEARQRLEQQEKMEEEALLIEEEFVAYGLHWTPLVLPYSQLEIQKRRSLLESQASLSSQWAELVERAHKIHWKPKQILLTPVTLEAFRVGLELQEEYYERICEAKQRVKKTMNWEPSLPKAPYEDPSDYEEIIQEQLVFHAELVLATEKMSSSVKTLLSVPKPPYSKETIAQFCTDADQISSNRLADRLLAHRRWGILVAPLLGIALYFGIQQWTLKQQVDALRTQYPQVGESIPHPTCVECPPLHWPSYPLQQYEIDAFHTNLLEHSQRMKRFQQLVQEAEAVSIDTTNFQKNPTLHREAELKELIENQYVPLEKFYLLRRDAERLRIPTKGWKTPITVDEFRKKEALLEEAKKLHEEAQILQKQLKIPIPFVYPLTASQLGIWTARVRLMPKIQELFQSYEKISHNNIHALSREVEQELFSLVMERNPSLVQDAKKSIHNVHWFDAVAFADRLNWYLQIPSCYVITNDDVRWTEDCLGWRLPTKEEWFLLADLSPRGRTWESANFRFPSKGSFYGDLWEIVWDRFEEPFLPSRPFLVGGDWNTPASIDLRTIPLYGKAENISFRLVRGPLAGLPSQPDQQKRPVFDTQDITNETLLAQQAYRFILEQQKNPLIARMYAHQLEEKGLLAEAEEFYEKAQEQLCLPLSTRRVIDETCNPKLVVDTNWMLKEKGSLAVLNSQLGEAKRLFSECSEKDITCFFAMIRVMLRLNQNEEATDLFCMLSSSERKDSNIAITCDDFVIPKPNIPKPKEELQPE